MSWPPISKPKDIYQYTALMEDQQIPGFISCDWGTSRLRLRYVDTAGMQILAEVFSNEGIGRVYNSWQALEGNPDRFSHFMAVITRELEKLEKIAGRSTTGVPLLCSGMGSSSIGIRELPYSGLPFGLDGSTATVANINTKKLSNPVFLISGVKSEDDIMRGEETELLGAAHLIRKMPSEYTALLPGTHSKHIRVKKGEISEFQTYMTGEIFDLLKTHSTLKYSVGEPGTPDWDNFRQGLQKSRVQLLLKNLFQVRINEILKGLSKKQNHDFLSGLLIGAELQPLVSQDTGTIVLMGNDAIRPYYRQAMEYLGIGEKLLEVPTHIYDLSALTGQWLIYQIQTKTA